MFLGLSARGKSAGELRENRGATATFTSEAPGHIKISGMQKDEGAWSL